MANCLKMAMVNGIDALLEAGWSQRRIARALGINRETVARYARRAREAANPATAPPGSGAPSAASGSASRCEPFREIIEAKLEIGLSAKRIHQDLVAEHGFTARYYSVRRFVQQLGRARPLPFRRMECEPGQEAQIDFGKGAPVISTDGKRRRTHVLRIVLRGCVIRWLGNVVSNSCQHSAISGQPSTRTYECR